jgi:hypothetical protein
MKHCIVILSKQKCLSFKNGEQEGKAGPVWGLVLWEKGGCNGMMWKSECDRNIMYVILCM